jgi:drug/metabolite transporter (DMT)-like permease
VPPAALALALASAGVHATWNLLIARARDPQGATAVALITAALVGAPVAALWWRLDAAAIPFVAVSIVLEAVYFGLLAAAYQRAELSVVYPLARGLAPVFVLVGTVAFAGASTSTAQTVGVLLVGGGVLLVRGLRKGDTVGFVFGLAIAVCIASYTVVDKHGVAHATPVAYLELISIGMAVCYVAMLLATRGAAPVRAEANPASVVAGVATFAAYALVLAALRLASAASVAAVRETSVLIATALAAVVLKERVTAWRLAGAVLVVGGVALISV